MAETALSAAAEAHSDDWGVQAWREALLAAAVLAIAGSAIGGIHVKARAGPVRDLFLDVLLSIDAFAGRTVRAPAQTPISRFVGGIDLSQSVSSGRLVAETGLFVRADCGLMVLPMAERLEPSSAAAIGAAMDLGFCPDPSSPGGRIEARFAVAALDEATEENETISPALADRLGLTVCLDRISFHAATGSGMPSTLPLLAQCRGIEIDAVLIGFLSAVAMTCARGSLRRLGHLILVTRILAALSGRERASEADAVVAARLCFAIVPRAPAEQQEDEPTPAKEHDAASAGTADDAHGQDNTPYSEQPQLRKAAQAPADLETSPQIARMLAMLDLASAGVARAGKGEAGKAGMIRKNARRGRQYGLGHSAPFPGARPDIVATLRAAAPWQAMRARERAANGAPVSAERRFQVRKSDFRFRRLKHAAQSVAIFVVDASGSTAHERLGEAKGAVEQLLARCYVRRDEVALIAFRGTAADMVLQPTRSLIAAKRKLAAMPGGGPTPLGAGLHKALVLAQTVLRAGNTPVLVVLTDGSGNIALDGKPDRKRATEEVERIGNCLRALQASKLCIDVSRRPRGDVAELSRKIGAEYHFMRQAESQRMSQLVDSRMKEAGH